MSNAYQEVTARIISELETGAVPWVKPWRTDGTANRNIVSGKPYRGINRLILGMAGMAEKASEFLLSQQATAMPIAA